MRARNVSASEAVDRTHGEAAYVTVARFLRAEVTRLRHTGERLPTEGEVAAKFSVSRQTVRRAFQTLVNDDLVVRVRGRGTFVNNSGPYLRQLGSIDDLMSLSVDTDLEVLKPLAERIDVGSARRLDLDSDSVMALSFRRLRADVPFCLTRVFLPPALGARLAGDARLTSSGTRSAVTVIGLLDNVLETAIVGAEQSINVSLLEGESAAALSVADGTPALLVDRSYYDSEGKVVELAISEFLPDQYSYRVRLRRSGHG